MQSPLGNDNHLRPRTVFGALRAGAGVAWSRPGPALAAGLAVALYGGAQLLATVGSALLTWPGPPWSSGAPHQYLLPLTLGSAIWFGPCILVAMIAVAARRLLVQELADYWATVWPLAVWLWLPLVVGYPLAWYTDLVLPFRRTLPTLPPGTLNALTTMLMLGAGTCVLMSRYGSTAWPGGTRSRTWRWHRVWLGLWAGVALAIILPLAVLAAYLVHEPYRTPVMLAIMLPYCMIVGALIVCTTAALQQNAPFARPVSARAK